MTTNLHSKIYILRIEPDASDTIVFQIPNPVFSGDRTSTLSVGARPRTPFFDYADRIYKSAIRKEGPQVMAQKLASTARTGRDNQSKPIFQY